LTLAATIKKALASVSRRDNHRPAATANHQLDRRAPPIQIVAQYTTVAGLGWLVGPQALSGCKMNVISAWEDIELLKGIIC